MDDDQQFCLRWNNHQSTLISVFDTLLENETLVDCTLAAEGKFLKAHKVVLSACSPYFAALLQEQYDKHPIFILKDVKYQELRAMMDYMYRGEVNISQDQLAALLKAAESLQIKGLSDNRTGSSSAPKPEHHRGGLNVPAGMGSGASKLGSGYTLEQTKRARIGPSSMDSQDMSGSREGSSSPSRRRRKVRRRSIENAMADVHDNSNSSQIQSNQASSLLQQQQQSNASLAGVGAITAAASALASQIPVSAATLPSGSSISASTITGAGAAISTQGTTQQQLTTSVTKKTESVKGTSDAMNTENVQSAAVSGAVVDDQDMDQHVVKGEKQNHKQKSIGSSASVTGKDTTTELVIEPKSEYDDEGNEETVEDLTLDDEDMGMDDLDQNAGTSQGGEGSSQGYAAWQHDRSQDELLLATQEAQQRDPQDLSITRIAGLTWNEWNARLAMPLVTQLREGTHPLVFPTDLSISTMDKHNTTITSTTSNATNTAGITNAASADCKSPTITATPPNELNSISGAAGVAGAEGATIASSNSTTAASSAEKSSGGKLKRLTEEEARTLMLKAAAEKAAANANNSGNLSDNSYGEDNGNLSGGGAADYHSALRAAGAFSEVGGGAAGVCNINILSSISAMNSLISGGSGSAGNNGGLNAASAGSSIGGSGSGAGHPCPECGRVYKLKSSLRNHQKWECGKEPQFQCPFCVYRAKQKMHIGRHMERMHKEKFIKLEDLKSYTGANADDSSSAAVVAAAAAAAAGALATELRQHFS